MKNSLTVAVDRPIVCLDMEQPAGFQNEVSADLFQKMYDQLTSPRPTVNELGVRGTDWHNLRPDLAEGWWFSDDQLTCTFRLRRGVISHDGNELTANDVVWGWKRAFALRDVGKWVARITSIPDETAIVAVDRYTVAFHLSDPNPAIPRALAQGTPSVYDTAVALSGASGDDPWAKALLARRTAGFGAYRLESWTDKRIEVRAHDRYWRGTPAIAEVTLLPIEDVAASIEELLAGRVDFVPGIPLSAAHALREKSGIRIVSADATPGLVLHLDPTESPLDDPLVRQAIARAMPYREIIQTAYLGEARRWKSWLQPEAPGYAPDTWEWEEDIAAARGILAASTRPDGFETRLVARGGDGVLVAAEIIQSALARIGIALEIEAESGPRRSLVGAPKANLGPLMLRGSSAAGRGHRVWDPMYGLNHDFGQGRMRLVRYAYDNPDLYEAIRGIAGAGHGTLWRNAVRRAQGMLNHDAVVIPICGYRYYAAMKAGLEGYRWYPDNRLGLYGLAWSR